MGLAGALEKLGKAAWDVGKGVVSVVGDIAGLVDGLQTIGKWIGTIGEKAELDKVVEVGERLVGWAERVGLNRFLRAADSPILDAGQVMIAGMRLTTGFGTPDSGERFGKGAALFRDAGSKLSSARPNPELWSGMSAEAYAGKNAKQRTGAAVLAEADHDVHRIVATEAYQVSFHRDLLDQCSNYLADVGLVTFALGLIPGVGKAAKETAELAAVMAAVESCSIELYRLSSEVEANSAALTQLLGSYEKVDSSTNSANGGSRPPGPPTPPTSTDGRPRDEHSGQRPPQIPPDPAAPPMPVQYPGGGGGGVGPGGGAGVRGGGGGGAAPAMPVAPQRSVPATYVPQVAGPLPQASRGAAPAAMGAPAPLGAAPAAAASGIPTGLINQAVQAAVQTAVEKALEVHRREEKDREEKDREEKDDVDGEGRNGRDINGDGIPDELHTDDQREGEVLPVASVGEVDAGRAPIEPAKVSDPAPLARAIAATLDRETFHRADAGASAVGR